MALAFALAALPIAASAQLYDFTISNVSITMPPTVATALGPLFAFCTVKNSNDVPIGNAFPLTVIDGKLAATNVHVQIEAGTGKIVSWTCFIGAQKSPKMSLSDYLATAEGKAAVGSAVILSKADTQSGTF